jgi:VWFA-related protein
MKLWIAALALFPVAVVAIEADLQVGPQQPPIQLETRAELILIDATVVDRQGQPIGDLTSDDFVVSIDGQPRPIASIQFVKSAARAAALTPKASHYSTNEGESDGRRIMIVVDENSIPPGGARAVLMSIERLLKDLSPADRVAFIRLPQFENSIDFTTDRERVFEAVKKTTGKARRLGFGRVTLAESVAFDKRDGFQWQRALTRICSAAAPTTYQSAKPAPSSPVAFDPADEFEFCRQEAENEAVDQMSTLRQRARETLNGLDQVVSNLQSVPGTKALILLSQGFLSYDLHPGISRLAERAATARISLYAMHIDMRGMELDVTDASFTRNEDEQLMSEAIDTLVGASRGTRFRIVGTGEDVFARVARELSGHYLIGMEPADADRDGQPHRIKVEVKRPATTVRARAQFTLAAARTAAANAAAPASTAPADQLMELLRAATADSGVPLRFD